MRRLLAALLLGLAVSAPFALPAQATTFNVPAAAGGSKAEQDVYNRTVAAEIRKAKPGGLVSVSTYGMSSGIVLDALLDAHARKVRIHFLTWDKDTYNASTKLVKVLGHDRRNPSYAIKCEGSCGSATTKNGHEGANHAKLVTVSTTHYTNNASGNLTNTGDTKWNEFQSTTCKAVYEPVTAWIHKLSADKNVKNAKTINACGWKLYLLPQSADSFDPQLGVLKDTSCKPYKSGKRTVVPRVRVVMMIWEDKRVGIAKELADLTRRKCDVRVILMPDQTEPKVLAALRKGHVKMRNGGTRGMKDHAKSLVVDAKVDGDVHHYVFAGSANFGGYGRNTNTILRMDSWTEVDQHLRWFDRYSQPKNSKAFS